MNICGDSTRVVHPLFQGEDGGSTPTSPLQLNIGQISVNQARDLNALWHSRFPWIEESNIVRNRRHVCFGAEFDGIFFACAIWSSPIAANRLKDGDRLLELRRLAIADDAPKNTATRMIKIMTISIRKRWPELVGLISYQDTEAHRGTIYKAAGWRQETTSTMTDWSVERKRSAPQSKAFKVRWRFDLLAPKVKP